MTPTAVTPLAALPRRPSGLPARRRRLGLLLASLVLPILTAALVALRGDLALGSMLLLYLLAVVAVSVVGGIVAGVATAIASFLLANFFLTPPYHTLIVETGDSIITLLVFLVVAVTVSVLVDVAARRQAAAARSEAEADVLGRAVTGPLTQRSPEDVLAEVAATFGLTSVALVEGEQQQTVLARVGPDSPDPVTLRVPAGDTRVLIGAGRELFAEDRRLLRNLAHAASRAVDVRALAGEAERGRILAEVDTVRTALLAAVGHDLRTPLAGIKAAVTTLRQGDVHLDAPDRNELLAAIENATDRLTDLIANLLDLSRLEAGAISIQREAVSLDEVISRVLIDRQLHTVVNRVADNLPMVAADAGLLERIVANLVDNAHRHAPPGSPVTIDAQSDAETVKLTIVDQGPGVAETEWARMFVPFQRLHDRSTDTGIGLGLAIARGFAHAMGGTLEPSHTPGGGLTMTLTLPQAEIRPHANETKQ